MSISDKNAPTLECIILAAGESRRLGQPKQHVVVSSMSLLERSIKLARDVCETLGTGQQPIVVSGAFLAQDCRALRAHHAAKSIRHHYNSRWRQGMTASLACAAPLTRSDGVMVLLVDQYKIHKEALLALHALWLGDPERPAAARYADTLGPPVIWPSRLWSTQSLAEGNESLLDKSILISSNPQYLDIPEAATDLDTSQDLSRAIVEP